MNKNKIFIVDDDQIFLDLLELILLSKDFDVIKSITGESFFDIVSRENPDVVLLDINLPEKSGFEILKEVKMDNRFSKLPIIMITGDTTIHIDKAFAEGADDCIFKPVNIEYLITCIRRLIK